MGPQGSGKGTQAELLAKNLGIPTISAGALLREEIAKETEFGREIAKYTEGGTLVPDEIMSVIIRNRLNQPDAVNGWILDGHPRIASQMELFLQFFQPTHAILLELTDEQSLERLSGRLQCSVCLLGFHELYMLPIIPGLCDKCGGTLIKRSDDNPEAIKQRLEIYHQETEPLVARYEQMGILHRVDGSGTIEEVAGLVKEIFE